MEGTDKVDADTAFLSVTDCSFSSCNSTNDGGALFINSRNFTLSNGSFSNCSSSANGGGVCVKGEDSYRIDFNTLNSTSCSGLRGGVGIEFTRIVFSQTHTSLTCTLFSLSSGPLTLTTVTVKPSTEDRATSLTHTLLTAASGTTLSLTSLQGERISLSEGNGAVVNASLGSGSSIMFESGCSFTTCTAPNGMGGAVYISASPLQTRGRISINCVCWMYRDRSVNVWMVRSPLSLHHSRTSEWSECIHCEDR